MLNLVARCRPGASFPEIYKNLSENFNLWQNRAFSKMKIAFVHPDLGIGGAERLIVDAAVGLQSKGHVVHMYTSHHDPSHCFPETRNGITHL
jgi:alpha-1,3/alpha-1,6-mannosyltransferase